MQNIFKVINYPITDINKYGSMEVTLYNNCLIDNNSAFKEIIKFGNQELNNLMKYNNNSNTLIDLFPKYWVVNKERLYNEVINNNESIWSDFNSFVYNAIEFSLINRIFNLNSKVFRSCEYSDFDFSKLLTYINLLDIRFDEDENDLQLDYEDYINMLNDITLSTINNKDSGYDDIDEIKEITQRGIVALEQSLLHLLTRRIQKDNYAFPFPIRINNSNWVCAKAYSLFSICYLKQILEISGYNIDHNYKQCKYYKCINYFTKQYRSNTYCPECIKNKIPNILKNKKFNKKRDNTDNE